MLGGTLQCLHQVGRYDWRSSVDAIADFLWVNKLGGLPTVLGEIVEVQLFLIKIALSSSDRDTELVVRVLTLYVVLHGILFTCFAYINTCALPLKIVKNV